MSNTLDETLKDLLNKKPELVPPPDGLWESIHATWTGLWTDFHGEWDERQASDIFPITDLLSQEREEQLIAELKSLILSEAHRMAEQVIGEDEEPGRIFGPGMPTSQRDLLRKEQRLRLSKLTGIDQ